MMVLTKNPGKKADLHPGKIFFLGIFLVLGLVALPFFLNQLVFTKLKNVLPLEFKGELNPFLAGRLLIKNFQWEDRIRSEGSSKVLEIHYQPLEYVFKKKLTLRVFSKDISVKLRTPFLEAGFSRVHFDSLRSIFEIKRSGEIKIDYFFAAGDDVIVYSEGTFSKGRLDILLSLFLTPEVLKKLPPFVSEHLFSNQETRLKQIRLRAEGSWQRPFFYASSDLVRLELKSRMP